MLPPDASEPITLDGPGPLLWEFLARPMGLDEVSQELGQLYDLGSEVVAEDLRPVVEELIRLGALTEVA